MEIEFALVADIDGSPAEERDAVVQASDGCVDYDSALEESQCGSSTLSSKFPFFDTRLHQWFRCEMERPQGVRRRDAFQLLFCGNLSFSERAKAYQSSFGGSIESAKEKVRFGVNHGRPFAPTIAHSIRIVQKKPLSSSQEPSKKRKSLQQARRRKQLRKLRTQFETATTTFGVRSTLTCKSAAEVHRSALNNSSTLPCMR